MEAEVKGWQMETCFGLSDCPHRALDPQGLVHDLEALLAGKNLREFLQARVNGPLKLHHEFRVSLSACPNACSRPQIMDIGLIGSLTPVLTPEPCSLCGQCSQVCKEGAILLEDNGPQLNLEICLKCGDCLKVCPTGTLVAGPTGFRVLLGGKLGRHPQLGGELPGIYSLSEIVPLVDRCLVHFMTQYRPGQRFGDIINRNNYPII
jgi:dissimilatory sulfite reductase (desulfoviridin) alpha/beta subunit